MSHKFFSIFFHIHPCTHTYTFTHTLVFSDLLKTSRLYRCWNIVLIIRPFRKVSEENVVKYLIHSGLWHPFSRLGFPLTPKVVNGMSIANPAVAKMELRSGTISSLNRAY